MSKTLAFLLFDSIYTDGQTDGPMDGPMDGPTDGRTDKGSYRVACPQLKRGQTQSRFANDVESTWKGGKVDGKSRLNNRNPHQAKGD